ncbi:hypothetical protein D3C76_1468940 [compost metagenome]
MKVSESDLLITVKNDNNSLSFKSTDSDIGISNYKYLDKQYIVHVTLDPNYSGSFGLIVKSDDFGTIEVPVSYF